MTAHLDVPRGSGCVEVKSPWDIPSYGLRVAYDQQESKVRDEDTRQTTDDGPQCLLSAWQFTLAAASFSVQVL